MIIHPRHFIRFMDGRAGNRIVIAFLPGDVGACLKTLETDVLIRRDYALKLAKKNINFAGFKEIQNTIDHGYCILLDEHKMSFLYLRDRIKPEIYFLLLKTDRTRRELWLVTFHRIQQAQFDHRRSVGVLIRSHTEDFME